VAQAEVDGGRPCPGHGARRLPPALVSALAFGAASAAAKIIGEILRSFFAALVYQRR
jgi:hypothetical protein